MAYVQPSNRSLGELITTARWNQDVVANIQYLKTPATTRLYNTSTTTTSTTAVPIIETQNIITTAGGRMLVLAHGWVRSTLAPEWFAINLTIDGGSYLTPAAEGVFARTERGLSWSIVALTGVLTPAMHTARLYGYSGGLAGGGASLTFQTVSFLLLEV